MQRRSADHKHERAPLLQVHVRRADDQVVVERICDGRHRADAARRDDHPVCHEAAARERRRQIALVMHDVRETEHVIDLPRRLVRNGRLRAGRDDEMRLDVFRFLQRFEHADPIDGTGSA